MKNWMRRIRGAVGLGLTWAVVWSAAGGVLARFPGMGTDLPLPLMFAPLGFLTGVVFSGLLVAIERRRGLTNTSIPRFASWGVASGLLLGGVIGTGALLRGANFFGDFLLFGPALAAASAVCAAGSLSLARRAQRLELGSRSDATEAAELTPEERRELLGE